MPEAVTHQLLWHSLTLHWFGDHVCRSKLHAALPWLALSQAVAGKAAVLLETACIRNNAQVTSQANNQREMCCHQDARFCGTPMLATLIQRQT